MLFENPSKINILQNLSNKKGTTASIAYRRKHKVEQNIGYEGLRDVDRLDNRGVNMLAKNQLADIQQLHATSESSASVDGALEFRPGPCIVGNLPFPSSWDKD